MGETKDGGPAFPRSNRDVGGYPGMSLRDYFAGQALMGMGNWTPATPVELQNLTGTEQINRRVVWAYRHADAMLAAREETPA